jgi:hypothetical protein
MALPIDGRQVARFAEAQETQSEGDGQRQRSDPKAPKAERAAARGYRNRVNQLEERSIKILDERGAPAVLGPTRQPIGSAELVIAWTYTTQYEWNYRLPEFPGGAEKFEAEYPSVRRYLDKQAGAKTLLDVAVPDSPYKFYVVNGRPAPYFLDGEKRVLWQVKDDLLAQAWSGMSSISVASKRIKFWGGGGDSAAWLEIDFSEPEKAPRIRYDERYDGP